MLAYASREAAKAPGIQFFGAPAEMMRAGPL
jgi:hypothetical protein